MEWIKGEYRLSDDPAGLDLAATHRLLAATYWAANQPLHVTALAMKHSLCLGLFHARQQIGFARAVTDHATFAWICDVIVHPDHRGKGLGKWMLQCLIHHPQLQTRSQVLATRDAHSLYARFGFVPTEYLKRQPGKTA